MNNVSFLNSKKMYTLYYNIFIYTCFARDLWSYGFSCEKVLSLLQTGILKKS